MNKPLISIIVPVYNVEVYLSACIDTLIDQTYHNIEILLIDDGSTDKSGQICDDYQKKDARIKVLHKANGGLSDARNTGLELMRGEYVTCVDSDDLVSKDYIEILLEGIKKYNTKISVGSIYPFYDGKIDHKLNLHFPDAEREWNLLTNKEAFNTILLQIDFDVSACAKLYSVDCFEDVRYPKGKLYEDVATTYKLLDKSETIAFTYRMIYGYRRSRGESITGQSFNTKKLDLLDTYDEFYKYILDKFPDLKSKADCRYCSVATGLLEDIYVSNEEKNYVGVVCKLKKIISDRVIEVLKEPKLNLRRKVKIIFALISKKLYMIIYNAYYKK